MDVQNMLSQLPGFVWAKYKNEKHWPSYNYLGANTSLTDRLRSDDVPYGNEKPINGLDHIAYLHDLAYRDAGNNLEAKHLADQQMLNRLNVYTPESMGESLLAKLVKGIISAKYKLGLGVTEQVAKELHTKIIRKFRRRKVIVFDIDDIWSADLVDMQPYAKQNKGFRYILTVIDLFSKHAWALPLKDKTGTTLKNAFEKITKESDRISKKLWTDFGGEFKNKVFSDWLKQNNIELYHTQNEGKAMIIERFNRTVKEKIYFNFTVQGNQKWVDLLPKIIEQYNNSFHRTIKATPNFASRPQNSTLIFRNIFLSGKQNNNKTQKKSGLKVGDLVRIYRYKKHFEKGYQTNWTAEVFRVTEVLRTNPVTYKIEDLKGEEIIGSFYQNELLLTHAK